MAATRPCDLELSPNLEGRVVCSHDMIVLGSIEQVLPNGHGIVVLASDGTLVPITVTSIDRHSLKEDTVTLYMDTDEFQRRVLDMTTNR